MQTDDPRSAATREQRGPLPLGEQRDPLHAREQRDPLALGEYASFGAAVLTDAERWPTATTDGAARLAALRAHPFAPCWTHAAGDRLDAAALDRASRRLPTGDWLPEHLATARRLPYYRSHPGPLERLEDFPVVGRDDLVADVSRFVPLDADLDRMVHGSSSGTTGHALQIPDDVEEVARTFFLLRDLVRGQGLGWRPDPRRMALAHVVAQRQAFTYASLLSGFGQATMARLNLRTGAWAGGAEQRDAFLADQDPQVIAGNPAALAELLRPALAGGLHPLALVSGATALAAPLRLALADAFGCPVLDVYGLHETRPIAVSADGGPFVLLDRRMRVEVLDPAHVPVPEGERGELVVTAGENPLLPLVRYRTGDFGRLVGMNGRLAIADLEGREDTRFTAADGSAVPAVDLTQHLQAAGCHGWSVVQHADGALVARVALGDADAVGRALGALLGVRVAVERLPSLADLGEGKPRRYRSSTA